jgi:poly(beta-D-mannuronate) lyase
MQAAGCYFKAGCYVQSNTSTGDLPTAFGQVEISRLEISHS